MSSDLHPVGRLEAATGERIAALDAVEPERAKAPESGREAVRDSAREPGVLDSDARTPEPEKILEPDGIEQQLTL